MRWYSDLSVRYKILMIPLVGSIGLTLFLSITHISNTRNIERLSEIRDVYFPVLEKANNNSVRLDRMVEQLNTAVTVGEIDGIHFPSKVQGRVYLRLVELYGKDRAAKVQHAEAFEICEYGRRPDQAELKRLFPFFER